MTNENQVPVNATLSRWHKYVQRISDILTLIESDGEKTAVNATATDYLGPAQVESLQAEQKRLTELLGLHKTLLRVRAEIRGAIGRTNAEQGVDEVLATVDFGKRRLNWLQRIELAQHAHRVAPDELERVFTRLASAIKPVASRGGDDYERYDRHSRAGVDLQMLTPEQVKQVRDEIDQLRLKMMVESDRLSEINQHRLELSIPVDVAKLIGAVR